MRKQFFYASFVIDHLAYLFLLDFVIRIHIEIREAEGVRCFCQPFRKRLRHVIRQIPAVGPGIGDQLFLIQALSVIQCLLGRESEDPVGVALQGSQIIERRWLFCLFPAYGREDLCFGFIPAGLQDIFCFRELFDPVAFSGNTAKLQFHFIEVLRLEGLDLGALRERKESLLIKSQEGIEENCRNCRVVLLTIH